MSIYSVSRLLGHSSVKSSEKYLHSDLDKLQIDVSNVSLKDKVVKLSDSVPRLSTEANAVRGRRLRPCYGGSNPPFRIYPSPLYQILTIFLSLIIPLPEGNLSCKGDGGWQPILVSLKNFNLRLEKDVIYRKVVGLRCYFLRKCGRVGFFRVIIYRDFFNKNIIFGFYQETQLA